MAGIAGLARQLTVQAAWREFMNREEWFAEALWDELTVEDELDTELWHWGATRKAAMAGRRAGLTPGSVHRFLARTQMVQQHGFETWTELEGACRGVAHPWSSFVECAEELALARLVRERLFAGQLSSDLEKALLER
jgi:hypothetical protein